MSVGFSIAKGDIDSALGQLATDTRDMLTRGQRIVNCLSQLTDGQLENYGYDIATDIPLIRAVQADITLLLQVFPGQAGLDTPHDFLANLGQMYGAKV